MLKEVKKIEKNYRVSKSCLELGRQIFKELEPRDSMYKVSVYLIDKLKNRYESKDGERDLEKITTGDALLVLLLTWNSAFYRYGKPENFDKNISQFLNDYKEYIFSNDEIDKKKCEDMFNSLLKYLEIELNIRCSEGKQIKIKDLYSMLKDNFVNKENLKKALEKENITLKRGQWIACNSLSEFLTKFNIKYSVVTNGISTTRKSGIAVVKTLHLLRRDFFPLWDQYMASAYCGSKVDTKNFEHYWKFKTKVDKQKEDFKGCTNFYKRIDEFNYVILTQPKINKDRLKELPMDSKQALSNCVNDLKCIGTSNNIYLKKLKKLVLITAESV